jgi:hypothetical protein
VRGRCKPEERRCRRANAGTQTHTRNLTRTEADGAADAVGVQGARYCSRHEGDLFGIPPTGNKVKVTATVWYRVENGKLAEGWINRDDVGLMRQLGVIPSPE